MTSTEQPVPPVLTWIDLEMTGLEPESDVILEAVVVVTGIDLVEVAASETLVIHQPDNVLDGMNAWCVSQHGKSGLTAACRASRLTTAEAEQQLLAFLRQHAKDGAVPLCGNSVHQDRAFLRRHMPTLEAFFHYRNIDVSTLKELARRWAPALPKFDKPEAHRALDDVRASVAELRYYREHLFKS
ncbi:MAG: oligoribonuclease [Dehalococcoidia bacterium]